MFQLTFSPFGAFTSILSVDKFTPGGLGMLRFGGGGIFRLGGGGILILGGGGIVSLGGGGAFLFCVFLEIFNKILYKKNY